MKLGVMMSFKEDVEERIKKVHELGFTSCQLCGWDDSLFTDEYAQIILNALEKYNVTVSTFWCGWSGPRAWNFFDGPHTLGLIPLEYRFKRVRELKKGSDFAKKIGVVNIATHVGFIPEVPTSTEYMSLVATLRDLCRYIKENGQYFLFETGQETPVTLLRTITEVGTENLGLNFDTGNLIMYGKANPVDALDVVGKYVRDIHAKDAVYPVDGMLLGKEQPLGQGKVNFPAFIARLKELGYDGTITIEREITGEKQIQDINAARALLETLI